ncbi:serine hydrolase domain-containing protein [Inhella sp.]|uniref:serine hydrolase domain-containing protein n=1 Tax=Inhella sp. TaxID=1921806 RepID=UPI0035B1CC92
MRTKSHPQPLSREPQRRLALRGLGAGLLAPWLPACGGGGAPTPAPVSAPSTLGLDQAASQIAALPHLHALLVRQRGVLRVSHYANGQNADSLQDSRSVAKSVCGLLVAMAIERGPLRLEDRLDAWLPPRWAGLPSPTVGSVTVRDLLTMSSGLGGLESEFVQWVQWPDEIGPLLQRAPLSAPGEVWSYSTPNLQLLSVMFQQATGLSLYDYAKQQLFAPLGIEAHNWVGMDSGYTLAGSLLFLRAQDFLKIGELMLAGGSLGGRRLIGGDWVRALSTQHHATPLNGGNDAAFGLGGYGYLWWRLRIGRFEGYAAAGYAGQYILVLPALEAVVAVNMKSTVQQVVAVPQNQALTALLVPLVEALA